MTSLQRLSKDLVVLHGHKADLMVPPSVHTAKWIVDKCLRGDLLKGRTVILVVSMCTVLLTTNAHNIPQTHNLPLTLPLAELVISVKDGKVNPAGALDKILDQDTPASGEEEDKSTEKDDIPTSLDDIKSKVDGKLIVAEEVPMGRVGFTPGQF
jgi:hypothetical protein